MNKFALIGYPLGHSMSPLIHRELFKLNNIEATYELRSVNPDNFEEGVRSLGDLCGYNVTIPHKINIIPYLSSLSERAELFGAVNTVERRDGKLIGHNTDCFGFLRALDSAGITLGGKTVVCGSGGVSRMFAFEAALAGADLTVAVREADLEAGGIIKKEIAEKLGKDIKLITLDKVQKGADLIVNGTPVGMFPNTDACILPRETVQSAGAAFDAVYNPLETTFIRYAHEAGIKCSNGLPMLVWQAAVAQEIWLDVKFDENQIAKIIKITEKELTR